MNLEELKLNWAVYDEKLDRSIRVNMQVLSALKLHKTRSAMQRLIAILALDLAVNLIVVIALGSFMANHLTAPRFVSAALALDLCALLLVVSSIHQLLLAKAIDYSGPVAEIQKKIETLRIHKIKRTKWTLWAAPLIWTPLMIVLLRAFFGLDAYAFGGNYLACNLAVGLAVIVMGVWISKRYATRLAGSPFVQRLMKDIAGYNLRAATESLRSLEDFEKEGAAA